MMLTITLHHLSKTCILLTLQTGFGLAGIFGFQQMTLPLNMCAHSWCIIQYVKKHCCLQSEFFATNTPSKAAEMRSTTGPFAQ